MKNRSLRFESLEDRQLLAVWAGGEAAAAAAVSEDAASGAAVSLDLAAETAVPAPTSAVPIGHAVGDVYVASTLDADGDGFIGPAELSYMSFSWFTVKGRSGYNAAYDMDGDGFIGPGDYSVLSAHWFKTSDALPDSTKSYTIYPSDISNWFLFGNRISGISVKNGTLTINASNEELESVCDYVDFADDLRVTFTYKATASASPFAGGVELAVQDSGERYYFGIQSDKISIYRVGEGGAMTLLRSADYTFNTGASYNVWAQVSGGQVACGVNSKTLIGLEDNTLSGGMVGFYASDGINSFSNISVTFNPDKVENTPVPVDPEPEPDPDPPETRSNEDIVWDYLYAKIGNAYGVAGLMGNLNAESGGFRANNLQNSYERSIGLNDVQYTAAVDNGTYTNFVHDSAGYGIAQWTYWSRKQALLEFAQSQGKSIGDLNMQLDYLWYELSVKYKTRAPALKNATSVREASDVILLQFERPADQSEAARIRRASYGQTFYDRHVS